MEAVQLRALLDPIILIVAALGIIASIQGLRKQIRVTTYLAFTKRFEDVARPLDRQLQAYKTAASLQDLALPQAEELESLIQAYISLLSTEYHIYKQGYIDKQTWGVWSLRAKEIITHPLTIETWLRVKSRYVPLTGFVDFMTEQSRT